MDVWECCIWGNIEERLISLGLWLDIRALLLRHLLKFHSLTDSSPRFYLDLAPLLSKCSMYFFPLKCLTFLLPCIPVISSKVTFNVTSFLSLLLSSDQVSGVLFKLQRAAAPHSGGLLCPSFYLSPIRKVLQEVTPACSTPVSLLGIQNFQHLSNWYIIRAVETNTSPKTTLVLKFTPGIISLFNFMLLWKQCIFCGCYQC